MYSYSAGAGEGLVPTFNSAVTAPPPDSSSSPSPSLATSPSATPTTTTPQADPGLVASVRMVASALHDPACGLDVAKMKIKKQNLLNKIKKTRKFKGEPPPPAFALFLRSLVVAGTIYVL